MFSTNILKNFSTLHITCISSDSRAHDQMYDIYVLKLWSMSPQKLLGTLVDGFATIISNSMLVFAPAVTRFHKYKIRRSTKKMNINCNRCPPWKYYRYTFIRLKIFFVFVFFYVSIYLYFIQISNVIIIIALNVTADTNHNILDLIHFTRIEYIVRRVYMDARYASREYYDVYLYLHPSKRKKRE